MTYRMIISIAVAFLLSSCASTYDRDGGSNNTIDDGYSEKDARTTLSSGNVVRPNEDRKSNATLGQMIAQIAGVQAFGEGLSMSFKIRGQESIYGGTDPLFILDGRQVGTDFSALAMTVDPNQVKSIRALKGPDASIYGTRGANGVIVIRTKKP